MIPVGGSSSNPGATLSPQSITDVKSLATLVAFALVNRAITTLLIGSDCVAVNVNPAGVNGGPSIEAVPDATATIVPPVSFTVIVTG
jgi:hypothetical protein